MKAPKAPTFCAHADDDDCTVEIIAYRVALRGGVNAAISHAWIVAATPYVRASYASSYTAESAGYITGGELFATIQALILSGHHPRVETRTVLLTNLPPPDVIQTTPPDVIQTIWEANQAAARLMAQLKVTL